MILRKSQKFVSLKEATKISGYNSDYIGWLIRNGKIKGKMIYSGVSWQTTKQAILGYKDRKKGEEKQEKKGLLAIALKSSQEFISLKDASGISGYTPDYIGGLIRTGKLTGRKVYTRVSWQVSEKSIKEYQRFKKCQKTSAPEILGFNFNNFKNKINTIRTRNVFNRNTFNIGWRLGLAAFVILFLVSGFTPIKFLQGSLIAAINSGEIKTINFYPTVSYNDSSEAGAGWQNSENAQGPPNVGPTGSIDLFSDTNSATYKTGPLNLIVEDFQLSCTDTNLNQQQFKSARIKFSFALGEKTPDFLLIEEEITGEEVDELQLQSKLQFKEKNVWSGMKNFLESLIAKTKEKLVYLKVNFKRFWDETILIVEAEGNAPPAQEENVEDVIDIQSEDILSTDIIVEDIIVESTGDDKNIIDEDIGIIDGSVNNDSPASSYQPEQFSSGEENILPTLDTKIIIWYSLDGNRWQKLDTISGSSLSNALNGGYFSYDASFLKNFEDIKNLKIKFEGVVGGETNIIAYLDSVWVEVMGQQQEAGSEQQELSERSDDGQGQGEQQETNTAATTTTTTVSVATTTATTTVSESQPLLIDDEFTDSASTTLDSATTTEEIEEGEEMNEIEDENRNKLPRIKIKKNSLLLVSQTRKDFCSDEEPIFIISAPEITPQELVSSGEGELIEGEIIQFDISSTSTASSTAPENTEDGPPPSLDLPKVELKTTSTIFNVSSSAATSSRQEGQAEQPKDITEDTNIEDEEKVETGSLPLEGAEDEEKEKGEEQNEIKEIESEKTEEDVNEENIESDEQGVLEEITVFFKKGIEDIKSFVLNIKHYVEHYIKKIALNIIPRIEAQEIEAETEVEIEMEAEMEAEAEMETTEIEIETEAEAEVEDEVDTGIEIETEIETEAEAEVEIETETETVAVEDKIRIKIFEPQGRESLLVPQVITRLVDGKEGFEIKLPKPGRNFKPGKWKLEIEMETEEAIFVIEQDFTWGVLAINVNKSIYLPNEQAYIQMGVLRDDGHTICDASLKLEILDPSGNKIVFETDHETDAKQNAKQTRNLIERSGECDGNNVTDVPDYFSYYQVGEPGIYEMKLTNFDNGYEIIDSFEVRESTPFDIERIGPTRIYPPADYEMILKIKANQDFEGQIIESVPTGFDIKEQILSIKEQGQEEYIIQDTKYEIQNAEDDGKNLIWESVVLQQGDELELKYQFDAPDVSPYLYLLGPLEIGDFQEIRQWQIASDALSLGATITNAIDTTTITLNANHTTDANTKALVVVIKGYDSSDADSAVSSLKFGGVDLTEAEYYRNTADGDDAFVAIYYLPNPTIGEASIALTMGGSCTDLSWDAVNLVSASADTITLDNTDTGSTSITTSHTSTVNPAETDSISIGGIVNKDAATSDTEVTTGALITGSEADFGQQTAEAAWVAEGSDVATLEWGKTTDDDSWACSATFYEQWYPTVALGLPAHEATGVSLTPDLTFTGTDLDADEIEYQLQVDTSNLFGEVTVDSYSESNRDNDADIGSDAHLSLYIGQSFTGDGSTLKSATLYLKAVGFPTGIVYVSIYAHSGTYGSTGIPTGESLATSVELDVSTFDTDYALINFEFTGENQIELVDGTHYFLVIDGFTTAIPENRIQSGQDRYSSTHGGNKGRYTSGAWIAEDEDLVFYVYGAFPSLIDALSTDETGFSGTGDPHPWPSNNEITYTVQAGDALTASTDYYWRVRGKDVVTDTWGAWSPGDSALGYDKFTTGSGITISGTIYTNEGTTTSTAGHMVGLAVDGGFNSTTTASTSTGLYTFSGIATPSTSSVITVFLDEESDDGVTVTRYSGSGDTTGLDIYYNRTIVRHEDAGPITISDLDKYDDGDDADILYTATTSALSVDANTQLYIWPEKEFAPGGNITIDHGGSGDAWDGSLKICSTSTLTATGTESHSIGGSWFASSTATFTAASSKITFTATTTGRTITTAGNTFYDLTFNSSDGNGVWTFQDAATTTNDLIITQGTASSSNNMVVQGGDVIGNGTLNWTGGTFTLSGEGNFGGTSDWTFSTLTFGTGSTGTTTAQSTGTTTVSSNFSVASSHILNGSKNFVVSGGNTTGNGVINLAGGTFLLDSVGDFGGTSDWTFYNLNFGDGSGTATTTALNSATTTISHILTIDTSQILNAGSSKVWILSGSNTPFVKNGTFNYETSTFKYTANADTYITATDYYNLELAPGG